MKHSKKMIQFLSGVSILAALPAAPLIAQDDDEMLEEIIVSARRKEEKLQDVPGTVTAITRTTLERAGVSRAADFIALTPGVTLVDAAEVGDTQVNIRGINGARDAENSFAYILDGVLYTNPAAFNREYTDLAQIEIFKGPQGAIYGRNAAAGAIIVNTDKPDGDVRTRGTISYGEDSTILVKGSTTGVLIEDKAYFRLSGDFRSTDGFYRNRYLGGAATVDAYEGFNIKGRLVYDVNDQLSIDSKIRYGEVDASSITFNSTFNLPVFAAGTNTPAANQDVNDFDFVFDSNIPSDNDQKSFEFSSKFDYEMDDMTLTGWVLYSDISNNLMSDGTSAAFGFYAPDSACQASISANTGYGLLAPQFIGQTPTGVIFDPNGSFLGAYTPSTCDGIQEQLRNQKDLSAEIRLASNTTDDLQWMVGAYFLDIDRRVGVSLNRDSGGPVNRGLFQPSGPNQTAQLLRDQFDSSVFAVFGQIQYDVNEKTEISVALRYDNEKRKVSSRVPVNARQNVIDLNFDGIFNDPINPALSSLINPSGVIPDQEETFSKVQPKLSVTYDATEETTLFASWGVGFKAGGFNNSGSAATVQIFNNGFINGGIGIPFADNLGVPLPNIQDNYGKETSSAFEAGFKSRLMGGRLNIGGAAYYTKVDDMQFFEFFVGTFGLLRVVSNMDKVDIYGAELDINYAVNENIRVYAAGNITDSEIKGNSSRPDTVGNKAPYTADYTLNAGIDFDFDINEDMAFFARADAQFVGPTWFHTVQGGDRPTIFMPLFELGFGPGAGALGTANYANARRDAYETVNLRVGIRGESWTFTAYADNLFDTKYLEEVIPAPEFGGAFDHPGARRRIGAELSFEF
ncbi:TonB-dependent receptor [Temperatibacter marinus]|uniref:TonB-dependent receptor n=1 Tax=Temperatibacter marinus TaxID=1456591 RepID=A0AA52EEY5_9PROT|nr:TonB-dependent receptor [Temperatibacter marinus]WND03480.1 TonB-dependent receptor [Temperatibacter marinus]